MFVGRKEAKRHIVVRLGLNLARTVDPGCVAVKKYPHHHRWGIGRHPATVLLVVRRVDRIQIERVHHIRQKAGQVIVREPIMQRGWEQQGLVQFVGAEALTHKHILKADTGKSAPKGADQSIPDRLLAEHQRSTPQLKCRVRYRVMFIPQGVFVKWFFSRSFSTYLRDLLGRSVAAYDADHADVMAAERNKERSEKSG